MGTPWALSIYHIPTWTLWEAFPASPSDACRQELKRNQTRADHSDVRGLWFRVHNLSPKSLDGLGLGFRGLGSRGLGFRGSGFRFWVYHGPIPVSWVVSIGP